MNSWPCRPRAQHPAADCYAALAAAKSAAPLHLHGPVGDDSAGAFRALFANQSVTFDGFVPSTLPTFRWYARNDCTSGMATELAVERGCSASWNASLSRAGRSAHVLLVGCMNPHQQLRILAQSQAQLVGLDSRQDMIESQRADVEAGVSQADILFLNRVELAALVPGHGTDWCEAARSLLGPGRLRAVVVKGGPAGAACVTRTQVIERPAHPVDRVVDPTGAGDALAGGFSADVPNSGAMTRGRTPMRSMLGCSAPPLRFRSFGVDALVALSPPDSPHST